MQYRDEVATIVEDLLGKDDINFMPDVPVTRYLEIDEHPDFSVINYLEFSWNFIAFNMRKDIFQDINLRKALCIAVDIDDWNESIFQGEAEITTGPFPPYLPEAYNNNY